MAKDLATVCEDKIRWRGIRIEHLALRLHKVGYDR